MTPAQLQQALLTAQQAYLDLTTGAKVEAAGYGQGDGTKNVTFTKANIGALVQLIKELQAMVDPTTFRHPRRARRVLF